MGANIQITIACSIQSAFCNSFPRNPFIPLIESPNCHFIKFTVLGRNGNPFYWVPHRCRNRILLHVKAFLPFYDIFPYRHRLAHHPRLYKHGHKIHHEWDAPYAFMSQYCHPLEEMAVNALPCFLGPIIMGAHFTTMWVKNISYKGIFE